MSLEKAKNEVLKALFEAYLENPTAIHGFNNEALNEYGFEPHEFGKHLVDHGLVEDQQYRGTSFHAKISMRGIIEIAPEYLEENTQTVIQTLCEMGGRQSIMEILEWEPKDFQRAFHLAKYLEATGMIKEGFYTYNDVIIELSLEGKDYCEKNKPKFV